MVRYSQCKLSMYISIALSIVSPSVPSTWLPNLFTTWIAWIVVLGWSFLPGSLNAFRFLYSSTDVIFIYSSSDGTVVATVDISNNWLISSVTTDVIFWWWLVRLYHSVSLDYINNVLLKLDDGRNQFYLHRNFVSFSIVRGAEYLEQCCF